MIGMVTAPPEESGSDYATGHESTVGSPLDLAVGLRQGQPANPVEEDTNMESAPWGYRSFESIGTVNQFGEAAERILIHEWTPEAHDLATVPAQVGDLTGALNYLQNLNFEGVSAISKIHQVIQALSRELELHARGVQVDRSALTARVEALGHLLNEVNNEVQDQRSQLESKRAELQSTLEQATAAALEYRQVAEALKAKVDNSRQGWEQGTNELKRQLGGVLNEVTGLSSHLAQLDKSVEEVEALEGKVLNCDRVTTNMVEEIRRIGLNFEDAEKRVHGVEAMAESHKASISKLINWVHNLEHPAVLSTSTGEAGEAKVPATEVRRISANLEVPSAQVATLTGQMHHWETMPKPELAKVNAYITQGNGIKHTITSITPPSASPPGNLRHQRKSKPPQPVNQQTTKPRPEEANTHAQNHEQQHPRHQTNHRAPSTTQSRAGIHTTGGTTLTNSITSSPRHLLHTLADRATGTSQRPPPNTGH